MTAIPTRTLAPDPLDGRTAALHALVAAAVPSLAVAVTVSAALWLSAAALLALALAVPVAGLLAGRRLPPAAGTLAVLFVVAGLAGGVEIVASAWLPAVHADLGVFLPLTVVVVSGRVAASVLEDAGAEHRARRAVARALVAGGAFVAVVVLTAGAREALGAGTITLPGAAGGDPYAAGGSLVRLPAIAADPARGLLAPFAGLIAAGYLAGLAVLVLRRVGRRHAPGTGKDGAR